MATIVTYNHTNLEYLELMSDGDCEMIASMLEMLAAEIPTEIEKMQVCVKKRDWNELFELSHKYKTTLSYIGNVEMTNITKTIEVCSRERASLDDLPELVNSLERLSKKVMHELKDRIEN